MRGFGSILWAGGIALAALSCYLVSLQVASSRGELERVEQQIALTTREIRTLETEIGTRGRLAQLERWNVNFLRLSAPEADQFAASAYMVAAMATPEDRRREYSGPLIYASAPVEDTVAGDAPAVSGTAATSADQLIHTASYTPTKVEGRGPTTAPSEARTTPAAPTKRKAPEAERDPLAPLPSESGTTP